MKKAQQIQEYQNLTSNCCQNELENKKVQKRQYDKKDKVAFLKMVIKFWWKIFEVKSEREIS